jgi:hypothetical protein
MHDCDMCHRWFHSACTRIDGYVDMSTAPAFWFCDACSQRRVSSALGMALSPQMASLDASASAMGKPSDSAPPGGPRASPCAEEVDEVAFGPRHLAFTNYTDMLREFCSTRTALKQPWKLTVSRGSLVTDVLHAFSGSFTKTKLFQSTYVTFVGAGGVESGDDHGGLTAEMYAHFFREAVEPSAGLFARTDESVGVLPCPSADSALMKAFGRIMSKAVVDGHPLGRGLGRFLFEYLADTHERRVFCDPRVRSAVLPRARAARAPSRCASPHGWR